MAIHIKDGGIWKEGQSKYVKDAGVWKEVQGGYIKDGGIWKPYYTAASPVVATSVGGYVVYGDKLSAGASVSFNDSPTNPTWGIMYAGADVDGEDVYASDLFFKAAGVRKSTDYFVLGPYDSWNYVYSSIAVSAPFLVSGNTNFTFYSYSGSRQEAITFGVVYFNADPAKVLKIGATDSNTASYNYYDTLTPRNFGGGQIVFGHSHYVEWTTPQYTHDFTWASPSAINSNKYPLRITSSISETNTEVSTNISTSHAAQYLELYEE